MQRYEGELRSATQARHTTSHVTLTPAEHLQRQEVESLHIALHLEGHALPFRLRAPHGNALFLQGRDRIQIAGVPLGDSIEIYGLRNLTDGCAYLPRPAEAISRWGATLVAGTMALCWLGMVAYMLWDGRAGAQDYLQVSGIGAGLAVLPYALRLTMRRVGLRPVLMAGHSPPGDRDLTLQARALLGIGDKCAISI